ncbi:VOC family protein [Metabacillus sp. SLBN-84]
MVYQIAWSEYDSEKVEEPVFTIQLSEYTGLTLDAGPADITKKDCSTEHPLFNFHTDDIEKSLSYVKKLGCSIETEIVSFEDFSFFTISDPDHHVIMICTG